MDIKEDYTAWRHLPSASNELAQEFRKPVIQNSKERNSTLVLNMIFWLQI